MKNVLVLGINGTIGRHSSIALKSQGFTVSALMRDPKKLSDDLAGIQITQGDVTDRERLEFACDGVDAIVYGINPPNYDWREKAMAYLEPVAEQAEKRGLTLMFPGNVYGFDPAEQSTFDEQDEQHPHTEKGAIRKAMEQRLQVAASRGAKVIILRMGDFIAPNAKSAWLSSLISHGKKQTIIRSPGSETMHRSWAYVPDAAEVVVKLLQRSDELEGFNLFHLKGLQLSISDIARAMEDVSKQAVIIKSFPWWAIRIAAPFSTLFKGLLEMRYLWDEELFLSDEKLQTFLHGDVPATDIKTALRQSCLV